MAKWTVTKTRAGTLILERRKCCSGGTHVAGELRADTPTAMVIGWIATEGGPFGAGDHLVLLDGTVLALLPKLEGA